MQYHNRNGVFWGSMSVVFRNRRLVAASRFIGVASRKLGQVHLEAFLTQLTRERGWNA